MTESANLTKLLKHRRKIRTIGVDDTPFAEERGGAVGIVGAVCAGTRFEGMLFGNATKDGDDATGVIIDMLRRSKFLVQLNILLTDGIAVGGFNIIDLKQLHEALNLPCVAVMRRLPDMPAVIGALRHFSDRKTRLDTIARAGPIHQIDGFTFQVQGASPPQTAEILTRLTDTGKVPEALRLAHIIGSAIVTGESGRRA